MYIYFSLSRSLRQYSLFYFEKTHAILSENNLSYFKLHKHKLKNS